jgi:4-hydroxy 2-oxovalerate aldolase
MVAPNTFKILDCTIRDGGYLNNWRFDKRMVREVYRALSKAGIDYVEIGFRGTEKYFDRHEFGLWRFTDFADLKEVVGGIKGAKLAIMGDYGKLDGDDISGDYREFIDLVRLAVHKDNTGEAIRLLQGVKSKGFDVSLNAMGITSYTEEELKELANMLAGSGVDYLYIADSYGSILPDQLERLITPFRGLPDLKVGFHPHNSLQMAFANTLEAIKCGIDMIDCTIYGMGRGAGNLPTEVILSYLQLSTTDKYNVIPVLHCIDRFFMEIEVDEPWGYQLPYMLSGIFQCHPYYPKTLVDYREFSMEDIWNALEVVQKLNPVGFSKSIVEGVIKSGMIGGHKTKGPYTAEKNPSMVEVTAEDSVEKIPTVSYENRYQGKDFLILAGGPTLKEYKTKIDRFIQAYDPIILGANYLSSLFEPHYHAFNNKKRFVDYIDTVEKGSHLLIGENIEEEMIREYTARNYETLFFVDALNHFDISGGVIQCNCRTISVLLMAVAIVMGAKRVFAVGMDGYTGMESKDGFHFYSEKVEPEEKELVIERHRWNQRYIEQIDEYLSERGMEGVHILTPTSHKAFYKGIENYL